MLPTRIRARAWPAAASQIRTVPSLPPVASHWLSGEIAIFQRLAGHPRTPMVTPMAPLETPLAAKRAWCRRKHHRYDVQPSRTTS